MFNGIASAEDILVIWIDFRTKNKERAAGRRPRMLRMCQGFSWLQGSWTSNILTNSLAFSATALPNTAAAYTP